MTTQEQNKVLKIDVNVFELVEDTELENLEHFSPPLSSARLPNIWSKKSQCHTTSHLSEQCTRQIFCALRASVTK